MFPLPGMRALDHQLSCQRFFLTCTQQLHVGHETIKAAPGVTVGSYCPHFRQTNLSLRVQWLSKGQVINSKAASGTESQVSKSTVHLPLPPPHLSVSWTAALSSAKEFQRLANGSVWGLVGGCKAPLASLKSLLRGGISQAGLAPS